MGTGKTSVGWLVAENLNFGFLDTDEMIQSRTGRSIADIFAKDGEAAFRALEREVVGELSTREKTVISTGGGLPANPENLAALKTHALVVCLWSSPEKIWERVRHQSHRPLLHDPDPQNKIRKLLAAREPFYKQADVLINTDLRSAREVAQQIELQFKLATRK
ncbi:MAG TPA: shikimate kinase [Bryobacteraceae bacterium]|nr:shikimate kinase [Bryobacteraceae bacterium]